MCCSLDEVVVVQFFYPDHTSDFTEREKKYRNAGECRELLEAKKTQKKSFEFDREIEKKSFFNFISKKIIINQVEFCQFRTAMTG